MEHIFALFLPRRVAPFLSLGGALSLILASYLSGCTSAKFYGNREKKSTPQGDTGGTATQGDGGTATSNTGDEANQGGTATAGGTAGNATSGNATSNTGDEWQTGYETGGTGGSATAGTATAGTATGGTATAGTATAGTTTTGTGSGTGSGTSGSGSGSGTGGGSGTTGGDTGGKPPPPVFHNCLSSNPNLYPIYVRAYDIGSLQEDAYADFNRCATKVGDIYELKNCRFLQDNFDSRIKPKGWFTHFCMQNFDVSPRRFEDGFPKNDGSSTLVPRLEWFVLEAKAELVVLRAGNYRFRILSDDGSLFFVDNVLRVENDGVHHPQERIGDAYPLEEGPHLIRMHYFQGPRFQIALQLYWNRNGGPWQIVPREAFRYIPNIETK
jgi:hypothetical protein